MSGLIIEIQKSAIDDQSSVEALLFKVKLAASKLQLDKLESWIEEELNGYSGDTPDYRNVIGQPVGLNPYSGEIPIYSGNPEMMEIISRTRISQSIGSIEDSIKSTTDDSFNLPMPAKNIALINKMCESQLPRMHHTIARGTLVSIISRVRSLVLDWSIQMEGSDVIGKDFSFSPSEKAAARGTMQNITIGNFIGNFGSDISSGDISGHISDVGKLGEILMQLEANKTSLIEAGINGEEFEKITGKLNEELSLKSPDETKIAKLSKALNSVLIGASGSLVAQGAITALSAL